MHRGKPTVATTDGRADSFDDDDVGQVLDGSAGGCELGGSGGGGVLLAGIAQRNVGFGRNEPRHGTQCGAGLGDPSAADCSGGLGELPCRSVGVDEDELSGHESSVTATTDTQPASVRLVAHRPGTHGGVSTPGTGRVPHLLRPAPACLMGPCSPELRSPPARAHCPVQRALVEKQRLLSPSLAAR